MNKSPQDIDQNSSHASFLEVPTSTPRLRVNKSQNINQKIQESVAVENSANVSQNSNIKRTKTLNKPKQSPSVVDIDVMGLKSKTPSGSSKDLLKELKGVAPTMNLDFNKLFA